MTTDPTGLIDDLECTPEREGAINRDDRNTAPPFAFSQRYYVLRRIALLPRADQVALYSDLQAMLARGEIS